MIQVVNSRYTSLILNHHSVAKLIISLTLTLLKSYFFNTQSVDLTLGVLLCIYIYIVTSQDRWMAVLLQDDQAKIEHHVSFFSLRIFLRANRITAQMRKKR